ncbi:hypothetical protein [Chryseosolibacter indicus]|uniref:Uncharacterized protein n=1 Tax=Chryseosolibacter indicus TaxID=2782351 RepID=A0ABS5VKL1_9BACT|nr:hypothetical protein [Chryseosolibacter indicus]MBT1701982.1 hypothetical protein [Chryseosolibacter indicus]
MSQAFVREMDDQWLSDVAPTVQALIRFLTMENNGIGVYEKKTYTTSDGKEIHEMSNGLGYYKNAQNQWEIYK